MKTYRVQRMTESNYHEYMSNDHGSYTAETLYIEAESAEEAYKMAQKDGYYINKYAIRSLEDIEAEEKAIAKAVAERKAKEEAAKAKRAETEARKAAEAGMTVAEYRAAKALKAKIKRIENEVAELEAELARKKAYLAELIG